MKTNLHIPQHLFAHPVESQEESPRPYRAEFLDCVNAHCIEAHSKYQATQCVETLLKDVDAAVENALDEYFPLKRKRKGRQNNIMRFPVAEKQHRDERYALLVLAGRVVTTPSPEH